VEERVILPTRFPSATDKVFSPVPALPKTAANRVEFFSVPAWEDLPWIWHGFSTRRGGVSRCYCPGDGPGELNLGFTPEDDRGNVLQNRALFAEAVTGDAQTPLLLVRQTHSSVTVLGGRPATWGEQNSVPCKGDGLLVDQPGLLIGIQTADCIPVLVADLRLRAVAAFHAGWRGTVKRIVESGVGRMRLEFGSRPDDLVAAIGPGIGACCYAIGEEVVSEFESQFSYAGELLREVYEADPVRARYPTLFPAQRAPGQTPAGAGVHLDLVEANRRQLLSAGLAESAIQIVPGCTHCHPELFFSYRNSKGRCGRMMSVIGIRPA
jgi:YfiH family protein